MYYYTPRSISKSAGFINQTHTNNPFTSPTHNFHNFAATPRHTLGSAQDNNIILNSPIRPIRMINNIEYSDDDDECMFEMSEFS